MTVDRSVRDAAHSVDGEAAVRGGTDAHADTAVPSRPDRAGTSRSDTDGAGTARSTRPGTPGLGTTRIGDRATDTARSTALGASLARIDAAQDRFTLTASASGPDWIRCSDLLDDPQHLTAWWARTTQWLQDTYGEAPGRTALAYVMSWYLRIPAYAGAALLFHERRVPSLRPDDLAVRLATDGRPSPEAIAVLGKGFACLPFDPACADPQTSVAADERELAAILRGRYTGHAARFVRTYRRAGRIGTHTLWSAATDALDDCLWWAGRDCGDEGAGVADATLVLDAPFAPLTSPSTLGTDDDSWARRRQSCCFTHLLPGRDECAGCPRLRRRTPERQLWGRNHEAPNCEDRHRGD
ncbi:MULTISPECIES: (2Fe-2S)-binding protein [Prauserella salsuginis group]|uniref:(2Fe-2S)-binding protein n=1 Tax=Prauserella salsuginis TaxID=387889 RepID=A0ABW6G706_9PSEU|nr:MULTISPECIES: iron-sulfur protein [Prauserella salsuginis group]MCR3720844.1 Ferric iron reductase protein FhuF, involved in iron transport [Prauserella flava]MCR3735075.1 Ferric iron reductase protein FhuF, involved in iron transport [Prauserella salsuginis]